MTWQSKNISGNVSGNFSEKCFLGEFAKTTKSVAKINRRVYNFISVHSDVYLLKVVRRLNRSHKNSGTVSWAKITK